MKPTLVRRTSGFLLGTSVALVPGLVFALRPAPQPSQVVLHDYFPPPHLAADHRFRIVAFGSSSTHGYGASSPAATYPAQLQHLFDAPGGAVPPIDVVNRGLDGEEVTSMLGRLDDDILPRRPDLVVWQLGSNDALRGTAPEAFATQLRDGIARIRAAGIPLVLVGPQWNPEPSRAALFGRMNDVMVAASRDNGLPMVNRFALMQHWIANGTLESKDMVAADGLHMTDQGYALLARAVFAALTASVPELRRAGAGE